MDKPPVDAEFVVITPPREPLEGEVIEPPLSPEEVSARIGQFIVQGAISVGLLILVLLIKEPSFKLVMQMLTALGWK